MAVRRVDLLQGTLDLLVLKVLSAGPNHGYGIASRIHQLSADALRVEEGSLYPALQRLLVRGWITDTWGHTSENRRARYYRLTSAGRKHLEREVDRYQRVARAIAQVLSPA